MRTKIYFNLLHHNVFSFITLSNVTDIVNKSSVSFFYFYESNKKNSRVVVVQDRIIRIHDMQKQTQNCST